MPSVGVVIGLGLSDAWGVELEIERGFMTAHVGSGESVLISFPPSRNPTRQEIELYGIRTRDERTQTAGPGWAAHARWHRQDPGRVNVGLLAGLSSAGLRDRAGAHHDVRITVARSLALLSTA